MAGVDPLSLPKSTSVRPPFFIILLPAFLNCFCMTDVFDGAMITIAMFTMNLIHPGLFLKRPVSNIA